MEPVNETLSDRKAKLLITLKYPNQDMFQGMLSFGRREDQGVYTFANGDQYKGTFEDNCFQGDGEYSDSLGNLYRGTFFQNKAVGLGTIHFHHEGRWMKLEAIGEAYNRPQCSIKQAKKEAAKYEAGQEPEYGPFSNQFSLEGEYLVYEGRVDSGKASGEGVLQYVNGDVFRGQFLDGLPHGIGKVTRVGGDVLEGTFRQGLPDGTLKLLYSADCVVQKRQYSMGEDLTKPEQLEQLSKYHPPITMMKVPASQRPRVVLESNDRLIGLLLQELECEKENMSQGQLTQKNRIRVALERVSAFKRVGRRGKQGVVAVGKRLFEHTNK